VVVDLKPEDDEQSIFDTLNTAGVRLTSAEIVKNALFKRLIDLSERQEAIKTYRETWEKVFSEDEDALRYWEKELTTGRLKRQNIEILLHSVAVIEGFYDPDRHTLSDLSKLYKKKIEELKTTEEMKNFIAKIIEYAKIYEKNIYDFDKSDLFSFSNDLDGIKKRLLHILSILDISTFHPFILYIIKSKDETEQEECLKDLENFVICNAVSQKVPIKNYNKLVKQFIKDPTNLKKEVEKITKEDIEISLKKVPNKLASLILFWIELYRRHKEKRSDILELKYTYSLEHIMPAKWREYWNFDKVPHPNNSLAEVEKEKDREEKLYWLGNMTLLRSRLNASLRNYDFERKINGEGRKRGIRHYADLLITKDIVEKFDQGDKVWNEEKIENRTKEFTDMFLKIWSVDNV
ncbi:MAG TPA: HNH endonuclease, partial [Candidatus Altiarchaeales archaeon]|nr:HNH endonuclease [Candidatus Altiarchaeales archaeon]